MVFGNINTLELGCTKAAKNGYGELLDVPAIMIVIVVLTCLCILKIKKLLKEFYFYKISSRETE